jgi:DNA polymerase I-like protein with 3'-5' exonuclease and polymerase domains
MTHVGIARELHCSQAEARKYREAYFERYPENLRRQHEIRRLPRKELEGFCFRMTIEKDAKLADRLDAELAVQRDETKSDQDFCDSDVQFTG